MMAGESPERQRSSPRPPRLACACRADGDIKSLPSLTNCWTGVTALALLFILLWRRRGCRFKLHARLAAEPAAYRVVAAGGAYRAKRCGTGAGRVSAAGGLRAGRLEHRLLANAAFQRGGREKALESLPIAALFLLLGGSLISLGRLPLPALIGLGAAPLVVLSYIILAGHVARSLRERHERTHRWRRIGSRWRRCAGWPGRAFWARSSSRAASLKRWLARTYQRRKTGWASGSLRPSCWLSSTRRATSLRGDNRRVTGYLPLWLIAFGVGASFIAQLCRGVAQFYLREFGADTAFSEAELLLPITVVWLIGLLVVAAGIVVYALGYFARRPAIRVVEPSPPRPAQRPPAARWHKR